MWKVIVADDEPFIREALKEMIPWDELGCHLAEALKNGKEVVNAVEKYKPDIVFSKGGFVAVPVVLAAKHYKVPVIIHESDMTPGLANKLCLSSASKICCNFPETVANLPAEKAVLTGTPIRQELLSGSAEAGRKFCGFTADKPVLMVIGGSLGAASVNDNVRKILPELLKEFQVVHLCGKGKTDESLNGTAGYVQYEYIQDELPDLFAMADIVISRAGANAICEIRELHKPNLLIPLSAKASRGDQIKCPFFRTSGLQHGTGGRRNHRSQTSGYNPPALY